MINPFLCYSQCSLVELSSFQAYQRSGTESTDFGKLPSSYRHIFPKAPQSADQGQDWGSPPSNKSTDYSNTPQSLSWTFWRRRARSKHVHFDAPRGEGKKLR
ncbi:hypothetical protein V6Z92_003115 [Aspergillus fumigatus]